MIAPCLSDVIVTGWEGPRARFEPVPAAFKKKFCCKTLKSEFFLDYVPETTRKGKVDLFTSFLFSDLFCSSLNLLPIFCPATCIISWLLSLHFYSLLMYLCLCAFSFFFSFSLLFPELFFQPGLILCFLLWSDQWESEDDIPSQRRCRNPGFSQSVKTEVAAMQDFQCLLH